MSTITLIGLGPGDPMLLTRAAWDALTRTEAIYTPSLSHPALSDLPTDVGRPLPAGAAEAAQFLQMVARERGSASCALPGHPSDHPLLALLRGTSTDDAADDVPHLLVIPGISIIDTFCAALSIDRHHSGLHVFDVVALTQWPHQHHGQVDPADATTPAWVEMQGSAPYMPPLVRYPLNPGLPALVWHSDGTTLTPADRAALQALLAQRYPPTHPLILTEFDQDGRIGGHQTVTVEGLAALEQSGTRTVLYIPACALADDQRSADGLYWVISRLLGPNGCPWDVRQTHQSLRGNLLEEAYEVLDALDQGDMTALADELGDLLMQVLIHSEMARQAGHFALGDVLERVGGKLMRRHPHVFTELRVSSESDILRNWERIKANELAAQGRARESALDGIPAALPSLATAQKMGHKAARANFDWPTLERIWEKLHEELDELTHAYQDDTQHQSEASRAHLTEELGDALYALAQVARWLDLDAESALRAANAKFRQRFQYVEQAAQQQGRGVDELSLEEAVSLWNEAKQ
jgi:tetrapyrrole methylase family protein/MazG family protein